MPTYPAVTKSLIWPRLRSRKNGYTDDSAEKIGYGGLIVFLDDMGDGRGAEKWCSRSEQGFAVEFVPRRTAICVLICRQERIGRTGPIEALVKEARACSAGFDTACC
jgi:hypothetical protein